MRELRQRHGIMVIDGPKFLVNLLCVERVSREEIEQVGEDWSGGVAVPRKLNIVQSRQDKTYLPATTSVAVSPLSQCFVLPSSLWLAWSWINHDAISRSSRALWRSIY